MTMRKLQMVDLGAQYLNIKKEIDQSIQSVVDSCAFINGPEVKNFQTELEEYLDVKHVIPCGNGTDALQIALMALEDRKSTRLNSSHVAISYAVFCLKNKQKIIT